MAQRPLKTFLFLAFVILIAGAAWLALKPRGGGMGGHAPKIAPVTVSIASVTPRDMPLEIDAVGTVVPLQSVGARSRIDSQITGVKFNAGDFVKAGDILFMLDDKALQAQLSQAEAAALEDKSQIENLQNQYDRAKKGIETGFSSSAVLDDAKAALDAKAAAVKAADAAVKNIETQLSYAEIRSPIDGRTGTINVTLGNTVKANDTTALVTINQVQPIYVQASLPQDKFESIRDAMGADSIEASASRDGAEIARGTLAYIDNAIDAATGTFATRAVFKNEDERLWPGMLVNLAIKLGKVKNMLTIPAVAVQHDDSGDYVFMIANGKAHKASVKIARIQGEWAALAGGLAENDQVATDGMLSLKDGAAVTLPGAKAPATAPAKTP